MSQLCDGVGEPFATGREVNPPMKTVLALPDDLVAHYTGRVALR